MTVICPSCQGRLKLSDGTGAGRVRCPRCDQVFAFSGQSIRVPEGSEAARSSHPGRPAVPPGPPQALYPAEDEFSAKKAHRGRPSRLAGAGGARKTRRRTPNSIWKQALAGGALGCLVLLALGWLFLVRGGPEPASNPRFEIPIGYYAGVVVSEREVVKTREFVGVTLTGGKERGVWEVSPDLSYGTLAALPGSVFLYVRFHSPRPSKEICPMGECTIDPWSVAKSPLGYCNDPNGEYVDVVHPDSRLVAQHAGSIYLLYLVPATAKSCTFSYQGRRVELLLSTASRMP